MAQVTLRCKNINMDINNLSRTNSRLRERNIGREQRERVEEKRVKSSRIREGGR